MINSSAITIVYQQGGSPNFTNGAPVISGPYGCIDADQLAIAVKVEGTQPALLRLYWSSDTTNIDAAESVEDTPATVGVALRSAMLIAEWRVPVCSATPASPPYMITRPVSFPFFAIGVYSLGATVANDKCTLTIMRQRQSPLQVGG